MHGSSTEQVVEESTIRRLILGRRMITDMIDANEGLVADTAQPSRNLLIDGQR